MAETEETPEFHTLIERSSLGSAGTQRLRAPIPQTGAELMTRIAGHQDELAACQEAGDRQGMLKALAGLAGTFHALGRDDEALALTPELADILHGDAEPVDRAWALASLAIVCQALGRGHEAASASHAMLAIGEAKDRDGAAYALTSLAAVLRTLASGDEALDLLARIGQERPADLSMTITARSDDSDARTPDGEHSDMPSGVAAIPQVAATAVAWPAARNESATGYIGDTRILGYEPLLPPAALLEKLPLGPAGSEMVERFRSEVCDVLDGTDDRLLVVTGPCSVHDPVAGLDYARQLAAMHLSLRDDLLIVMRIYFDKPRTVTGWRGLINDPGLDGSHDMHRGLRLARRLLLDVTSLGLPVGCEWLDPITPQYIADTVAWGSIGARTTESQVHRELASGLSMPVGFKNGTGGDVGMAVDACRAAAASHTFFGVTRAGAAAVITTAGNPDCHVILRGGRTGPNYQVGELVAALDQIAAAGLARRVMVDASHANSGKDYRRQPLVAGTLASQISAGEPGIVGIMLESFLQAGRQDPGDPATLVYGQSVTDACMDIKTTAAVLGRLAAAARHRRSAYCR